jgi:SNF2 family DNA or RNA helicase
MGLGKTLQVITALLYFKQQGLLNKNKALVVAPTSLITNWQKEIHRFAPSLTIHIYHGSARKQEFDKADITLTSYGLLRNDLSLFEKAKWYSLIIDEAQNIKNHSTDQTKAVKKLKAEVYIAMSGTPVENRLGEYWSIFDFTNKGYLGAFKAFNENIAQPIHLNHDQSKIEYFRRITAPFIMRRLKTDKSIIADLPDKIENNQYCGLTDKQAALYQSLVDDTMQKIETSEGIERKGLVLSLMMALKQIGNHPYQYMKQGDKNLALSGKAEMLIELLRNIIEVNEKVLVFTQFKEMGDLLESLIRQHSNEKPLFLHGALSRKQRDEMVELFQKTNHHRVFILSLKAGGTGLNLTGANHVIHYDLWWNPAVEAQATDRAFRIGQTKNVMVHRLINKGTLEEKIDNMLNEKRMLANLTVTSGETWLGDLKNNELRQLVNLEM